MNNAFRTTTMGLTLIALLAGCSSTPPEAPRTGLQIQAYQASEFSASKRVAFAATLSVFQDLGFIIDDGDLETGLITATGPTLDTSNTVPGWLSILLSGQSLATRRHQRVTAYVETMPSGFTRVRLNFVYSTQLAPNAGTVIIEPVDEPGIYQDTFVQIDKAIFVRMQAI